MNNNTTLAAQKNCAAMSTDSTEVKIIKTVLYSSIMLAALIGNLFVLYVVYIKKNMRRTTNIFIANMAASDMFIAGVIIPRILAELFLGPKFWIVDGILGSILCKICFFFTDFSICISITSHAVIAIDRFWAIVYSLRPSPITPSRRRYIIVMIWLYAFAIHSPNLYTYQLRERGGNTFCRSDWSPLNANSPTILFTIIFIFVICIPLTLILVLYFWLVVSVMKNDMFKAQTQQIREQRRKEDVAVLRNVVVMVTVFLVSLLPITILGVLSYYVWGSLPCRAWGFAYSAHKLLLSNSAINPWLCIFLHQSYRKHLRETFYPQNRRENSSSSRHSITTKVQEEGLQMMGESNL